MEFFKNFYEKDYNAQTSLLALCIKVVDINRRRVSENVSTRHCTMEYYIPKKDSNIRICQKTLCKILKVTPRRIQILVEKIKFDKPLTDSRGLHGNHTKISDETKEVIRNHISSFPRQENHYSRNDSKKECLSSELNIRKMWEFFRIKYPESTVKLHTYRDVFNGEFNLRFGLPRSDTCSYCDRLYIQLIGAVDDHSKKQIENESKIHHMRADSAYKALAMDKENAMLNSEHVVLCVDLQQVLFCPNLQHSNVFYQRQLSCYNLAIHDQGKNLAYMFFWNETTGKRGAAEIVSCVMKYVQLNFEKLRPGQVRTLKLWSDRCVGQNNNWRMIAVMQHLLISDYFTTVEQKFMTTGHSFLPCDRDFAIIERAKRGKQVYIPHQWVEIIANAKASPNPFTVCVMDTQDFKNTDIVLHSIETLKFSITSHVWYQISKDDPTTLRARKSHNVLQTWTTHSLAKKVNGPGDKRRPPVNVQNFPPLYNDTLPIKAAKKKDLMNMCQYIPQEYVEYYENIKVQN